MIAYLRQNLLVAASEGRDLYKYEGDILALSHAWEWSVNKAGPELISKRLTMALIFVNICGTV